MNTPNITTAVWRRSSCSNGGDATCVEWSPTYADAHGVVPVRDSKAPHGPVLLLSPTSWAGLVQLARNAGV
ncbi:DUF397 domain-containing protein [Streptomyces sp. NPDC088116]|uniref:DUF397 domain-containing protein n=1 Tax=Streptomyces sp. NPDC088116 TaxID=3365825 RepID=UPI0038147E53